MNIKFVKVSPLAQTPSYGSENAAGADLYTTNEESVMILPGATACLHTGLAVEIPEGYVGLVYPRSGLACKRGLAPANKVGVIDSDYRGEILVYLYNQTKELQEVAPHERVAQLVITPYVKGEFVEATELTSTERGANGFGSTGTN